MVDSKNGNGGIKKKVYDMSKDEQEHWEQEKQKHDEPFRNATMAIQTGVDMVLEAMGINVDSEDDVLQAQMMSMGIFIKSYENQPHIAPQIQGLYIFQWRFPTPTSTQKEPVAIAFIGNPGVDSSGQINVQVHWFDKEVMRLVKGMKLKEQV